MKFAINHDLEEEQINLRKQKTRAMHIRIDIHHPDADCNHPILDSSMSFG